MYKFGGFAMKQLKYQLVMDYIKNEISNETLKKGDMIDSETQLMKKFNVSRYTVREALNRLISEDMIYTEHGKGSFVKSSGIQNGSKLRTSKTIVVMVSYLNNHIMPQIIQKIEELASNFGYNIILRCTHSKIIKERECLASFVDDDIAGLIVEPAKSALPSLHADLYGKFAEKNIPVVFIHGYLLSEKQCNFVIADDDVAAYTATKYLIDKGHRTIGAVFKSDDMQGLYRYRGFMRAILEANIAIEESNIFWLSTQDEKAILQNKSTAKDYFKRLKDTTATVCYNDDIAINVADLLFAMGVSIPNDHSIISFDNTPFGSAYRVPITSMDHPKQDIGKYAFHGLLRLIENPNATIRDILTVPLIEKSSVKEISNQ